MDEKCVSKLKWIFALLTVAAKFVSFCHQNWIPGVTVLGHFGWKIWRCGPRLLLWGQEQVARQRQSLMQRKAEEVKPLSSLTGISRELKELSRAPWAPGLHPVAFGEKTSGEAWDFDGDLLCHNESYRWAVWGTQHQDDSEGTSWIEKYSHQIQSLCEVLS